MFIHLLRYLIKFLKRERERERERDVSCRQGNERRETKAGCKIVTMLKPTLLPAVSLDNELSMPSLLLF